MALADPGTFYGHFYKNALSYFTIFFFFIFFQRNIDKTRVTCIKWIPGSQTSFIAAHSSGCMYVYNYDVLCPNTVPAYQLFKQGKGFTVYTCKTKTTRNPVYKWTIGKKGSKFLKIVKLLQT